MTAGADVDDGAAPGAVRRIDWRALITPRRLRYRIVAVFLGLLLVVQTASLMLVGNRIGSNAHAAVESDLDTGARVFKNLLDQNTRRLTDAARVLALDYGFRSAVASQDAETLASALQNHSERIGASVALFTDAKFKLQSATEDSARAFLAPLEQIARAPGTASSVVLANGQAYQLVVVPVKAPTVIGWVALGFKVDDALLTDMKRLSVADLALVSRFNDPPRWEVVQSTLGVAGSQGLVGPWLKARGQGPSGGAAGPRSLTLDLHGIEWSPATGTAVAREVPLGSDGEHETIALVLRSFDAVTAPYDRLKWILLGSTLVAIAVFAVGSAITADLITTPLSSLAASARRLGGGDYSVPVEVKAHDEIGALAGAFESMRLAVRERDAEVRRLAFEDPLTQLPNRERFRSELKRALGGDASERRPLAVVMLDLDRFKHVNDVLGHRFGDRLLKQVAERLVNECRRDERDLVARLGGDEFALLLPEADGTTARDVARRIQIAFQRPISLDDHTVDLGAGIGIACSPQHAKENEEADTLLGRAEIAMYAAKQQRLGVAVYEPSMDTASDESLSLLSELRLAVEQNQLRLFLQPKIALGSGAVIGAEALVRWQHPQRGMIPPMKFIPFAEQTGFIRELTGWMLTSSAILLHELNARRELQLKMSINLSTRDLLDQDLPAKLARLLEHNAIDARTLCLEITESAMMDDPQRAQQTLERLHQMGFKLSIDDFGTGYSSLAYLKRLPVDELKIDKSFVLNMESDLDDAKIVRSTIDLAHNLGLSVVAEGVESAKAWKLLGNLRCDEAQGYFVARPMPGADFADWAAQWRRPQVETVRLDTDFSVLAL